MWSLSRTEKVWEEGEDEGMTFKKPWSEYKIHVQQMTPQVYCPTTVKLQSGYCTTLYQPLTHTWIMDSP